MGKVYNIACHIIGNRDEFFNIQNEYFTLLNQQRNYLFIDTSCISRDEYLSCGQFLWHYFIYVPIRENQVDGKFIKFDIKWGFYYHQWHLLSEILTKYNYSWRHIIVDMNGYGDDDPIEEVTDNEHDINNFNCNVQSYFILDDSNIRPFMIGFVEMDEI